jgi:glycosyltransferase involved in cell wall biosynthesis
MNVLEDIKGCVIIPTYNNGRTLSKVLDEVLCYSGAENIIVVDDGSTDQTAQILASFNGRLRVLTNERNRGKGYSLRRGFEEARRRGFENAITIDSDGQHFPSDIPLLVQAAQANPGALIMGSRNLSQEGVPGRSSFGNKFSSFWFWVHTGHKLPDTQTGFLLYPLEPLRSIRLVTNKFETEIEVIVKMAWNGVEFAVVPIQVLYDPDERVSHFRPFRDFSRISVLNTWFFLLTMLWYLPKRLIAGLWKRGIWNTLKAEIVRTDESDLRKAFSIGFGFFMGIVPIWGFQLLVGIPAALAMRLNKVLFFLAANISIPPMIPLIIYASYKVGAPFFPDSNARLHHWKDITLESIHLNMLQYATGAVLLALVVGLVGVVASFLVIKLFRRF